MPLQRCLGFSRRDWSVEEKDRIVAESYSGEMSVSAVARRHVLSPRQLFTCRLQEISRGLSLSCYCAIFAPCRSDLLRLPTLRPPCALTG
ncbi:transposase [Rhizobium grahamii]|uniref:transposase n=1 Tax=Rhizobium grahamii TaxID=1120045 RepID=UPI001675B9C0